jgi:hypothetical protein
MTKEEARKRAKTFFENLKRFPISPTSANEEITTQFWEELYWSFKTRLLLEYRFDGQKN